MKYIGIQTQICRNNIMSALLLLAFPVIILAMIWVFLALLNYLGRGYYDANGEMVHTLNVEEVNAYFVQAIPQVLIVVGIWFVIAYFSSVSMIRHATGAHPLTWRGNPRVYNIMENLCMTYGMDMPKVNVIDDPQLNAFTSGINAKTYIVTFTTGIINRLSDEELTGVVAHKLTHIRNKDARLLVVSIIFVGIVATTVYTVMRMLYYTMWMGGGSCRSNDEKGNGLSFLVILFVGLICCAIAYFFTIVTRFAISRKREYMADAGGAELCGNPMTLANTLRKLSQDPGLDDVKQQDVAQLFIMQPDAMLSGLMGFMNSLFSTHPDTRKRIAILEQL